MVTISTDVKLMAHLLRRAGFGATKEELDQHISIGYEKVVDLLIDNNDSSRINDALVRRYFPDQSVTHDTVGGGSYLLYRLILTNSPLREKIALFWHNVFATGYSKVTNGKPLSDQLRMFRSHGLSKLDELLLELSKDPAMIIWLDNVDNHNVLLMRIMVENFLSCFLWELVITLKKILKNALELLQVGALLIQII